MNGHSFTPSPFPAVDPKRDTLPAPPSQRGGFWRGVCVQPGRERFYCTMAFQCASESEALEYVARLLQRPKTELEVEAVSSPGSNPKGRKR